MRRGATAAEIRRAYRSRARQLHPDRPGGDARAMQALNEAWRVLGDPRRRRAYDRSLEEHGAAAAPDGHGATTDVTPAHRAQGVRAAGGGDPLALVPAALVVAAVLVGSVGVVLASPGALAAAALLGALGGSAFALAPVVALRRDRRRRG